MVRVRKTIIVFLYMCLALLFGACGTKNKVNTIEDTSNVEGENTVNENNDNEYEVIYTWDNSESDAKSISGMLTADWNHDGTEDVINIETEEVEGSEIIKKFELSVSGCDVPYIIESQEYYFIDAISGNFDSDIDTEIVLLFDMRYAGGNGSLGIQLIDFNGTEYVNITDGFFSGYEYFVEVKSGNDGSYVISRAGGEKLTIDKDYVYESAMGTVTGFYSIEILENDGVNYIRIRQYVAGEDMTDHVGDVICVFEVTNNGLTLLDEKVNSFE